MIPERCGPHKTTTKLVRRGGLFSFGRQIEMSGHQKIGRPTLRWTDSIQKYTKETQRKNHKTGERGECKLNVPTQNGENKNKNNKK